MFGAAGYRSQAENPTVQYCYVNSSTSDKLFDMFTSRRTEQEDKIEFIIEKQVGETASGQVYELQMNKDGGTDDKHTQTAEQQGSGQPDRIQRGGRRARLHKSYILKPSWDSSWLSVNPRVPGKDISQSPLKNKKWEKTKMEHRIVSKDKPARDTCRTIRWVKRVKKTGIWTLHTFGTCLPS